MTKKLRIAAIGDIHVRETSAGLLQELFNTISQRADVLVMCGDLTDHGLPAEAEVLVKELASLMIPCVGVLGNHDLEGSQPAEIKHILRNANFTFLDDEPFELNDVGFAGVKGFMGGFDKYALGCLHWEEASNSFVQEAIDESLKLEEQLARLKTPKKIVAMHYSPIRATVEGESLELYPFLGSSRLAQPIDNFKVSAAFHGHAHYGSPEGKTTQQVSVFNVSMPVRKRINEKEPFFIFEL
jgi:Icc-related predicted phosphoesterase